MLRKGKERVNRAIGVDLTKREREPVAGKRGITRIKQESYKREEQKKKADNESPSI